MSPVGTPLRRLVGRGDGARPPYHPWMQVLRSAMSRVDPELLLQHRPDAPQWPTHLVVRVCQMPGQTAGPTIPPALNRIIRRQLLDASNASRHIRNDGR